MLQITGISGSLRRGSFNRRLIEAASRQMPTGAELTAWEGLDRVPPFDEDAEPAPPAAVTELREAIIASDGLLIATPEYNGSIPGQLKNALDWASRPRRDAALAGKPVAVTGASPSPNGAVRAQADLRKVLKASGAEVIDVEAPVPEVASRLDPDGGLTDPDLRERLDTLLGALAEQSGSGALVAA